MEGGVLPPLAVEFALWSLSLPPCSTFSGRGPLLIICGSVSLCLQGL